MIEKSHSPCFSEVSEFPCPVAFLTACWERECLVIHAARAEALGGWNSVGAAVLSVYRLNPIIPVGDEWNPLPLCSRALMHCFLWEPLSTDSNTMLNVQNWRWCQSSMDLKNQNVNYYRTDMCLPVFTYKQSNENEWYLKLISTGAKDPNSVTTAPPNPPLVFHWLHNKQIFLHQCWRVGLGFSLYSFQIIKTALGTKQRTQ